MEIPRHIFATMPITEIHSKVMNMGHQEIMATRVTITESQGGTASDDLLYALINKDSNGHGHSPAVFDAITHVAQTAPELITTKGLQSLNLAAGRHDVVFAYLFDMINSCTHARGSRPLAELCTEILHESTNDFPNSLVIGMLLKGGANINRVNKSGTTLLSQALRNHDSSTMETIKSLLEHGADPNLKTKWCGSPLHQVLGWCRNPDKLKDTKDLLLSYGAKVLYICVL